MAANVTGKNQKSDKLLGFNPEGWIAGAKLEKAYNHKSRKKALYLYLKNEKGSGDTAEALISELHSWQKSEWKTDKEMVRLQMEHGEFYVLNPYLQRAPAGHYGMFDKSAYAISRDMAGAVLAQVKAEDFEQLVLILDDLDDTQAKLGALVGLELAAYSYVQGLPQKKLVVTGAGAALIKEASEIGVSTNIGRHLVSTPACDLNPKTYGEFITALFKDHKHTSVEIFDEARLKKEKMGLLIGVGQAAEEKARLVKISYRPTQNKLGKPLAFVGKGVTFDSGGLDLKPSGAMRLMKKDMGGSASVSGIAWYVSQSKINVACDFYLALAENAVSEKAMRPGDVLTASNGKTVEIHNTDAEGRLVMADALHYATTRKGKDEPLAVFDASTLTGAMRVALGLSIAGMCANDDKLSEMLMDCGREMGDYCWRMPLFDEYKSLLSSGFADMTNCASGGFGGGITAALFLKEFINDKKWIHLDFMAWTDKPVGALAEMGGNGQMVQSVIQFLKQVDKSYF